MANIDPTACREYLYKDFIQNSLKDGNIPVAFIAKCIEDGVIDCHDDEIILALERSLGIRINPKVPPTIKAGFTGGAVGSGKTAPNVGGFSGMRRKQSPVMSSAIPPCLKEIPQREMFRQTVEEMDKRIKGSHSHAMEFKNFPKTILYDARNTWATPELFRTLASAPNFEIDRLRAAMYPATMSYCERMFEENGRTYMVPYVTVMEKFNQYGETVFRKGENYYKGGVVRRREG